MGYLESYRTPGGQRRFSAEQIDQFLVKLQRGNGPSDQSVTTSGQRVAS
jgi:hypothetical protein